ncbi:MAG: hypothetical protein ACFFDP_09855 [Promethearchaeota archaeon]
MPQKSEFTPPICVVCHRRIMQSKELRIIHHGEKQFVAHGACLVRLRRLLCDFLNIPAPTPTITRALTLNEFLLTKRPSEDAEILACLAYYHQTRSGHPVPISKTFVKEQLRYTGYKIQDIDGGLQQAIDQLAYFEPQKKRGKTVYTLTEKGVKRVEHLPASHD